MKDLIGATILFSILIVAFVVVTRYTYLAWFQADEFLRVVRHTWPEWQRNAPIFRSVWKWMDTPSYIVIVRITTLTAFVFCIFLLVIAAKPIIFTVVHTFGKQ